MTDEPDLAILLALVTASGDLDRVLTRRARLGG
jgi:hypothetical protein